MAQITPFRQRIAARVAELRKKKNINLYQLAAFADISYTTIWKIENGKTNVKAEMIEKLEKYFQEKLC